MQEGREEKKRDKRGRRIEVQGRRVEERARNWKRVEMRWNVRRLSVRETNRRRLRRVTERAIRERCDMVLLTELLAEEGGMVWLGKDD